MLNTFFDMNTMIASCKAMKITVCCDLRSAKKDAPSITVTIYFYYSLISPPLFLLLTFMQILQVNKLSCILSLWFCGLSLTLLCKVVVLDYNIFVFRNIWALES